MQYSLVKWLLTVAMLLAGAQGPTAMALQACGEPGARKGMDVDLTDRGPSPAAAPHAVLGANVVYTVDDLAAWRAGLGQELRKLGVGALRFPGGEVADTYDWDRAGSETRADSGSPAIDFREFLDQAGAASVDNIYFVVNLEGAFRAPGDREVSLAKYADKAARLVAAVRKLGYVVRYWEIGNESYLAGTTYPLTAKEYAHALRIFSAAMRKADPAIRILANGPGDLDGTGFADTLTDGQREAFRAARSRLCGKDVSRDACTQALRGQSPGAARAVAWWQVLAAEAPDAFDDVAVHLYGMVRLRKGGDGFQATERILELKKYLSETLGRSVGVAVTEWNVPPAKRGGRGGPDAVISNVVKLGNFMAAGVQDAMFWPLRYQGSEDRALLTVQDNRETPMYRALQLASETARGQFISQKLVGRDTYVLRTRIGAGETVLMVNTGDAGHAAALLLPHGADVEISQVAGEAMSGGPLCHGHAGSGRLVVALPPQSVTAARLHY